MQTVGAAPLTWSKCTIIAFKYFKEKMYHAHPLLRLCEGDWKLHAYTTYEYPNWKKKTGGMPIKGEPDDPTSNLSFAFDSGPINTSNKHPRGSEKNDTLPNKKQKPSQLVDLSSTSPAIIDEPTFHAHPESSIASSSSSIPTSCNTSPVSTPFILDQIPMFPNSASSMAPSSSSVVISAESNPISSVQLPPTMTTSIIDSSDHSLNAFATICPAIPPIDTNDCKLTPSQPPPVLSTDSFMPTSTPNVPLQSSPINLDQTIMTLTQEPFDSATSLTPLNAPKLLTLPQVDINPPILANVSIPTHVPPPPPDWLQIQHCYLSSFVYNTNRDCH
ncbi:hypothetical protein K439DRAFT_1621978 [Ramaria rubella]|nr:hypothetical protein K439DRAFT_1621978 [Ramaria rubella]